MAQGELLKNLEARSEAIQATIEEMKPVVLELQNWKPEMEQSVDGLRVEVVELRSQVVQIAHNSGPTDRFGDLPPILPSLDVKHELTGVGDLLPKWKGESPCTRGEQGDGLISCRDELMIRGKALGENFSLRSPLNNGISNHSELFSHSHGGIVTSCRYQGSYHHHHPLPLKLDFPQFDGENPKA